MLVYNYLLWWFHNLFKATESLFGLGFGAVEVGSVVIDPERKNLGLRFDYEVTNLFTLQEK